MVWNQGDLDQTTDKARTHAFDSASYPIFSMHPLVKRIAQSVAW